MQIEQLKDQLANAQFEVDELGRVVIKDSEILDIIAGASQGAEMFPSGNCGCGGGNCNCCS